jgi:transcriptional regulator GlxA family with amidase domain
MKKITIVAFDNFTDIDVFLAWDLFNRITKRDKHINVKIVGTSAFHTSVTGVKIEMQGTIDECKDADVVFFASGPGTRKLMRDQDYLKKFDLDPTRQIICSMCSGSLILAALGILNGLTATTYPTVTDELRSFGVKVENRDLVVHGNIATAAGCLAALDLVGYVIEKLWDAEMREDILASVQPVGKGLTCIY